MPGDSLHKVLKLSARNETLMVRKDEGEDFQKSVCLDSYIKPVQKKQDNKTFYQILFGFSPKNKKKTLI